jgi:hypothetical protein
MGLGKRKTGGGENIPLFKFDARVGRFYTQDRVYRNGEWQSEQNDVTDGLTVVFDLKNIQHGYIRFPKGAAPETKLFPLSVEDIGDAPSDEHREGLRVLARLEGETAWREMLSTAVGLWIGLGALHDAYSAGVKEHPDQLPVAQLTDVKENKTANGTSWIPQFEIDDWIDPGEISVLTPQPPKKVAKAKPAKRGDMDDDSVLTQPGNTPGRRP